MHELGHFIRGSGLIFGANLLKSLRGLLFIPLLTRALSQSDYGVWTQLDILVALFVPLALLGLDSALTRFVAGVDDRQQARDDVWSIFSVVVILALLAAGGVWLLARPLASTFFGGSSMTPIIQWGAWLIITGGLLEIVAALFQTLRQSANYALVRSGGALMDLAAAALAVWQGWGLKGVVIALLVERSLVVIIGLVIAAWQVRPCWPRFQRIRSFLAFGLPLAFLLGFYLIINEGDRYVLGFFYGPKPVAVYAVAYALGFTPYILWYAPLWVLFYPTLVRYREQNRWGEAASFVRYCLKYSWLFTIPATVGLAMLAKPIITLVATETYVTGQWAVPLIGLGLLGYGLAMMGQYILLVVGRSRTVSLVYGAAVVVNLGLNIALVPALSMLGAALATLLTYAFMAAAMTKLARPYLRLDWQPVLVIKAFIAAAGMAGLLWWLSPDNWWNLLLAVAAGAALYGLILWLCGGFTWREIKQIVAVALVKPELERLPEP